MTTGLDILARDGDSVINIGSLARTAVGKHLGWYDTTPKVCPDGRQFYMYAGYYLYLITEGHNPRFLRAKTHRELAAKRKYNWEGVIGLTTHLESVLLHNLRRSPFILPFLVQQSHDIVWVEPDRQLRQAEKRWLRVACQAVDRLRREFH